MKVLIDPVYTSRPSVCSTSYLTWEIVRRLCEWRDDIFFYMMYPNGVLEDEEQREHLEQFKDRVKLIPYPYQYLDRMAELYRFGQELYDYVSPNPNSTWDYDAILTSRIPQIPNFKVNGGRPVGFKEGSYRPVIGLEEMPVFSFRKTVSWGNTGHVDLASLSAYYHSEKVVVNHLWAEKNILQVGRKFLAPSQVVKLKSKIEEAVPLKLSRLEENRKEIGDTIVVAFCGRISGTRNFKEVAELFRKHFSYAVGKQKKVKFVVSTHSTAGSTNLGEIDFIEIRHNNRKQFHQMLKEEVHVVVNLSTVEDFSLSTYEPLMFGIPVIVADRQWSDFLGEDYPFRADNFTAAYALVKDFVDDYNACYDAFTNWEKTTWKDLVESERNVSTSEKVQEILEAHEKELIAYVDQKDDGFLRYREIVQKITDSDMKEVDLIRYCEEHKEMEHKDDWNAVPIAKRPNVYLLKVLMLQAGWVDTNEIGVFRRQ